MALPILVLRLSDTHLLGLPIGPKLASKVADDLKNRTGFQDWPIQKLCSDASFLELFASRVG